MSHLLSACRDLGVFEAGLRLSLVRLPPSVPLKTKLKGSALGGLGSDPGANNVFF